MALYKQDNRYVKGKDFLKKLEGIEGQEIRYYVEQIQKHSDKLQERLDKIVNAISVFNDYGRH